MPLHRRLSGAELRDFEIVVVDDGSSDDTQAVLAERYDDPRLRVVAHESNRGINPSRHTGATNARASGWSWSTATTSCCPGRWPACAS